ncbi:intracellular ribonuclease LX-like [Fagus crenata]
MNVYWPNLTSRADNYRFWNHEYQKHGSCFRQFHSQQRLSYFRETVRRAEPFRHVLDMMFLSRGGILPNDNQGNYYLLGDIEDAIFNHFKSIPRLQCNYSNRGIIQLYEIGFCFDKNGTLRNCNNHFRDFRCCGNKRRVLFPRYS